MVPLGRVERDLMSNNDILPGFDKDACDYLTIELQRMKEVESCLALKLKGQLDTYSSPFFLRSVKKGIDAGFINLIFLLNEVDYVSSKAIGAFMQIKKAAMDKGGEIVMVDIHPKVLEIFKNLSLEAFFRFADSLDEAIAKQGKASGNEIGALSLS
jgi:anti-anti-sigma factor